MSWRRPSRQTPSRSRTAGRIPSDSAAATHRFQAGVGREHDDRPVALAREPWHQLRQHLRLHPRSGGAQRGVGMQRDATCWWDPSRRCAPIRPGGRHRDGRRSAALFRFSSSSGTRLLQLLLRFFGGDRERSSAARRSPTWRRPAPLRAGRWCRRSGTTGLRPAAWLRPADASSSRWQSRSSWRHGLRRMPGGAAAGRSRGSRRRRRSGAARPRLRRDCSSPPVCRVAARAMRSPAGSGNSCRR